MDMINKRKISMKFIQFLILLGFFSQIKGQNVVEKDSMKNALKSAIIYPFYQTSLRSSTGSVTIIKGENLSTHPTSNLLEGLSGRLASGYFSTNDYSPGSKVVNSSIRGLGFSTMVDGMNGSMESLDPMEIESVSLISGITDRSMLGSDAKFNMLMVNTRRGKNGVNKFDVSVELGSMFSKHLPQWTSGYDNALIYNKIRMIDGLTPKYDDTFLSGLQSGVNSLRYPNENYYNSLLNNSAAFKKIGLSYTGGSKNTQYFVFMGYQSEGEGLLKIQDRKMDRFRLRGNLDTKLSDKISLSIDFAGRFDFYKTPPNESRIFSVIQYYPSYAFPIVAIDDLEKFKYGTSQDFGNNPIADQNLLGGIETNNQYSQNKIQLNFDLSSVAKGLKLNTGIMYNIMTSVEFQKKSGTTYELIEPIFGKTNAGADTIIYRSNGGIDKVSPPSLKTEDDIDQDMNAFANLSYHRNLGAHDLNFILVDYFRYSFPKNRYSQVQKNDLSLSGKYAFKNKIYFEGVLTYTRDNYLPLKNRGAFFPAIGLGWIISEESFMKGLSVLNFMKLRANYGIIGSSDISNYYLSRTEWSILGGGAIFGSAGGTKWDAANLLQTGNPNLEYVKNKQFDIGVDMSMFNNSLNLQLNAYNYYKDGIVDLALSPLIVGNFTKYVNIGKQQFYGVELSSEYTGKINSVFTYTLGVRMGYKKSKILADNNPTYQYDWMNEVGNPTDGIYGYVAERLFQSVEDINASEKQFLGNVRTGDIKYADLDGNGKIEPNLDRKMIGHSSPNYMYGADISLNYKGFGLYILGSGIADLDLNVVGNTYFRPGQQNKYSSYASEMFKSGKLPTPTTLVSTNNAVPSTYFLMDGSYFKIKNIEFSYTLPYRLTKALVCKNIKLFARGTNLLTISNVPELDPEALNLGLGTYPSMMTVTGGMNITF